MTNVLRIGLLLCDDVDEVGQPQYGSYTQMFQNSLDATANKIKLTPIRCFENAPLPSPDAYDGYIISGSRCSVYEQLPWLPPLFEFIQDCWHKKIKIVGICFGHQLIAHALGGETQRSNNGWGLGVHQTAVTKPQPWMVDIDQLDASKYNLVVIHQDQVMKLGDKFSVIAKNDFCPNSMILAGDTMLGIQGHPEFGKAFCRWRADIRQNAIGAETYQNAINSLETEQLDSSIILKWIYQFLKNSH